ncbi:MAG: hypothetical protein QQN41_12470, partial [Nitrosopumilus sp.]
MDKLKWETVEYPIADFAPAGKVITQRDVLEKYKAEHPDADVKTFSGFKYNPQERTVSLRIAIADNTPTYGGSLKSIAEDIEQAKTVEGGEVESLKTKYDALVEAVGEDAQKFSDLLVENEKLKTATEKIIQRLKSDYFITPTFLTFEDLFS